MRTTANTTKILPGDYVAWIEDETGDEVRGAVLATYDAGLVRVEATGSTASRLVHQDTLTVLVRVDPVDPEPYLHPVEAGRRVAAVVAVIEAVEARILLAHDDAELSELVRTHDALAARIDVIEAHTL